MKHIWKQEVRCKECKGTGIYKGFAEIGSVGVVCNQCSGTGKVELKIEWEDFESRVERNDITRVAECNPGIGIDENLKFGGMPYEDWFSGKPFPAKSENRNYTCPAWWCQASGKLKSEWNECRQNLRGTFSGCRLFQTKYFCWQRWDIERKKKVR